MALLLKLSQAVRNARLDAIETAIGSGPILQIWNGTIPADCAAPDAGSGAVVLCQISLPANWMADATGGSKSKSGTWSDVGTVAAGVGTDATHFRIKQAGICHIQGTAGLAGATPDMVLDNDNIATNQALTVLGFTFVDANF